MTEKQRALTGLFLECLHGNDNFRHPIEHMRLGGVDTYITRAHIKDPIAEVHFIKGFKSNPYLYEKLLNTLNKSGINVTLVTLPDPADEIDFLESYEKIAKAVYIDGELDRLSKYTAPKIAANHSTGGFLLTKLLTDPDHAKRFSERYEGTVMAAPFYGSRYHNSIWRGAAKLYSRVFANAAVGTTFLESAFLRAIQSSDETNKQIANHRQALYMHRPTSELMQAIRESGFPRVLKRENIHFLSGEHDLVSHNPFIEEVANIMGAKTDSVDSGHSFIHKTDEGIQKLISIIKSTPAVRQALHDRALYEPVQARHISSHAPKPPPTIEGESGELAYG
ncbi:MAG: hypothetical protein ACK4VI_02545 [Alphaproteobacteria bacterium]